MADYSEQNKVHGEKCYWKQWKGQEPRELKHDHIWGPDTCHEHGCPSCCACVKYGLLCPECYEAAFFTWKEEGIERAWKLRQEYHSLAQDADVGPSLKGRELREKEGEENWLEISEKEKVSEWQKVDEEDAGPKPVEEEFEKIERVPFPGAKGQGKEKASE